MAKSRFKHLNWDFSGHFRVMQKLILFYTSIRGGPKNLMENRVLGINKEEKECPPGQTHPLTPIQLMAEDRHQNC